MKYSKLVFSALVAFSCAQGWAQTNTVSSLAVTSGVVTLTGRMGPGATVALNQPVVVSDNVGGMTYVFDGITGATSSIGLYMLTNRAIPGAGPDSTDFSSYATIIGPPTTKFTSANVAALLTANSYSGLGFAADDLGFGAKNFYMIHHRATGDYLGVIVPPINAAVAVTDLKPMSWAGGVSADHSTEPGLSGYFALVYANGATLAAGGAGAYDGNKLYYLRTETGAEANPGHIKFGVTVPALLGASQDTLDLTTAVGSFGVGGYTAMAFEGLAHMAGDIGYGVELFYYLRQDKSIALGGTGNTILGVLNPSRTAGVRTISDVANLGGVFSTIAFASDATGDAGSWSASPSRTNQFYVTGPLTAGAQTISFAAIGNHLALDGPFPLTAAASSGLDTTITVISGPASIVNTGTGITRAATVTLTGVPGVVKLRATRATGGGFTGNFLEQSFNVLGLPSVTSATTASAAVGAPFTYTITSTGDPILSYAATGLPANGLSLNTTTGVISGTPLATATMNLTLTSTNATGTSVGSALAITVGPAAVTPVVTSAGSANGTVGVAFSYTITASNVPVSFSAAPLPAGLVFNTSTGVISGTPTGASVTTVTLGATNLGGTGNKALTLAITLPVASAPSVSSASVAAIKDQAFSYQISATGSPGVYSASGLPAGLTVNVNTGRISGTPLANGTSSVTITAANTVGTGSGTLTITIASAITVTSPPQNQTTTIGGSTTFTVGVSGPGATYQWQKNGVILAGATGSSFTVGNAQLSNAGIYSVTVSSGTATTTTYAVLGFTSTTKVIGTATEVAANIVHPNGNVYDQVLLTGSAAAVTADAGQVTRVSFIDLNGDIVQVELSGAGTLTLNLEGATGPATPAKYNQPNVQYMKGHASLFITGADATTNVSVFTVGTSNAVDMTLFKAGEVYDGVADIGLIAIAGANGSFGGLRTANASYFRTSGLTGLFAPGVAFGPVYIGDIGAFDTATPVLEIRSSTDARITGGDLLQTNNRAVMIDSVAPVRFMAGTRSGGQTQLVQTNRARFEQNGTDVTSQMVAP